KQGFSLRPRHPKRQDDQAGDRRCKHRRGRLDRHQKSIAASRQRLDVLRRLCIVTKRLANLTDAEIEALVKVDGRFIVPDRVADLAAGDDLATPCGEEREHAKRLRRQAHQITLFSQLATPRVELERREAEDGRSRNRHDHGKRSYNTPLIKNSWTNQALPIGRWCVEPYNTTHVHAPTSLVRRRTAYRPHGSGA